MTIRFTEPGKAAVTSPAADIKDIEASVLVPALRLAIDEPNQAVHIKLLPVKAPSTSPVTTKDTERWLREAITAWEGSANDALDRAAAVISGAKGINMNGTLGNVLGLGGALLGPILPWAGAVSSVLGILVKDVISGSPTNLDLEGFRRSILGLIDKITEKFLEDLPINSKSLFDSAQHYNQSMNQAQENALLSVLSVTAIKKSSTGFVAIDESRLRAEIELGYLLGFAASGEKWSTSTGGSGPFVIVIEKYTVHGTKDEDGNLKTPDKWRYTRSKPSIKTYFISSWKGRIRSLTKLLKTPLTISRLTIPLHLEFEIEGLGNYQFITHTALWQPLSTFEVEFKKHTSEGNVIGPNGHFKMITVDNRPSMSVADKKVFSGFVSTNPRYQGYTGFSFDQIAGMILTREAWGGPFPQFAF